MHFSPTSKLGYLSFKVDATLRNVYKFVKEIRVLSAFDISLKNETHLGSHLLETE